MTSSTYSTPQPVRLRELGLTMIELLVTVAILSALIAGLSQLVVTNSMNANATGTLAGIADSGRTAIQLLTTDIRRAGYLGGNIDASTIEGTQDVATTVEPECVEDDPNNTNWIRMVDQPIFGLNDTNDGYACIPDDTYLRGDILTVRYVPATPIELADMSDDKFYLRTTMVEGKLFLGSEKDNTENQLVDLAARDYSLTAYSYFVGPTGRMCQGKEIPALFRKTIDEVDGSLVSQELIPGVENLQLRYLVDNRYYNANDVPLTDGKWRPVSAVEITVLVRAECPETGFTSNRIFDLAGVSYVPEEDEKNFRRQIFTTTTQLRN